jgi:hypothetical protein
MPDLPTATTPSVVVIGHINHDRVWRLKAPLRSGARITWSERRIRLGGGGYYTARRLMDLGRPVRLVSTLCNDSHGRWAFNALSARHYDLSHVGMSDGETDCADILIEPGGTDDPVGRKADQPQLFVPAPSTARPSTSTVPVSATTSSVAGGRPLRFQFPRPTLAWPIMAARRPTFRGSA